MRHEEKTSLKLLIWQDLKNTLGDATGKERKIREQLNLFEVDNKLLCCATLSIYSILHRYLYLNFEYVWTSETAGFSRSRHQHSGVIAAVQNTPTEYINGPEADPHVKLTLSAAQYTDLKWRSSNLLRSSSLSLHWFPVFFMGKWQLEWCCWSECIHVEACDPFSDS
jgi:hypothetical protein